MPTYRFVLRRGAAAKVAADVPMVGELLLNTDNRTITVGDGATAGGLTLHKASVGLGNVDNTSDVAKPVSTAQQEALDLKAPLASPAFTGSPTAPTPSTASGVATKGYVDEVVAGGSGAGASLDAEILADAPTAYWRCSEATGDLLDSSGNGYTLAITGTPVRGYSRLARGLTDSHHRWSSAYASRAGALGVATPWTGSWSVEFMIMLPDALAGEQGVFAIGLTGSETEARNYQLYAAVTPGRLLSLIWEYGPGNNITFSPPADLLLGRRNHVIWAKDDVAKVVRCYLNGSCIYVASYTQEPTGGSASTTEIGRNSNNGIVGGSVIGFVAHYAGTVLTPARVQAHAQAAGVM